MADILIVCVREDEAQAKALADMFERAGFSVGGAPSNEAALRSSGAAVVVWSQASIRSRPFLDAAQRVVNAGKAVIASLIEPPPASSLKNSPAFDLTGWTGDPDDPGLDPLYFAVDRMVNAARVSVGAAAPEPAPVAYEAPSSLRAPPAAPYLRAPPRPAPRPSARTAPPAAAPPQAPLPSGFQMRSAPAPAATPHRVPAPPAAPPHRAPPPRPAREAVRPEPAAAPHFAPQPRYEPQPASRDDGLGSEAEHWRAIRHSADPTDFLDYLAKYGPSGAFAELAEFRLRQLERKPSSRTEAHSEVRDEPSPQPGAPAAENWNDARLAGADFGALPAAPARNTAPQRRPDLAARRMDPPPPSRRHDAGFDRDAPPRHREQAYRDQPSYQRGGALRAFFLFLLIGGAAVGAGLYVGLGSPNLVASAPVAQEAASTFDFSTEESAAVTPLGGAGGPSEDVDRPSPPEPASTQRERAFELAAATAPSRTPAAASAPAARAPAPRATEADDAAYVADGAAPSFPAATGASPGPLQFGPQPAYGGQASPAPATSETAAFVPLSPSQAPLASVAAPAPASVGSVIWAERPAPSRISALYPRRALRENTNGRVVLDCAVRADLGVSCTVQSETPMGAGFGRAALNAAASFRARPQLDDGQSAPGAHATVAFSFNAPD